MEFESTEYISQLSVRCWFCGHTRTEGEFMSWCESHSEALCPKCYVCPEGVPQGELQEARKTVRRLAVEVQAFRSEQEG